MSLQPRAVVGGGDPAFAEGGDFFGHVVLWIMPQKRIRFAKIKAWQGIDWLIIKRELIGDHKRYNWSNYLVDATRGPELVRELERSGVRSEGYIFSATKKHALFQNLEMVLNEKFIQWPDISKLPPDQARILSELINQTQNQEQLHERVVVQYRHKEGEHDDLLWAFCLALYAARPYLVQAASVYSHELERENEYKSSIRIVDR